MYNSDMCSLNQDRNILLDLYISKAFLSASSKLSSSSFSSSRFILSYGFTRNNKQKISHLLFSKVSEKILNALRVLHREGTNERKDVLISEISQL